jgi:hypothetical protein
MADTWYVEYSFEQHATFHKGFKTICVVLCRPLLPAGKRCLLDSFPTTNEPR